MLSKNLSNKERYSMDQQIISILKKAPKRGIWMKELANKLGTPRSLLNYYLYGMKKNGEWIGGRLRSRIMIKNEGNNRFVSLKNDD